MQLRRHKDIVAIKSGSRPPVAYHARNLEVASVSEETWNAMAPTTFANGFVMNLLQEEAGAANEAYAALENWQQENSADVVQYSPKNLVKSLTMNVTQLCNLHCTYCAAGGDGTYGDPVARISIEKTLPQVEYFIDKLAAGEVFQITFLGGEPLLYPDAIKSIAEYTKSLAASRGLLTKFIVITNATLINEKALQVLTAIRANIVISIDGPPETHDLARPQKNGQGSSAAVVAGLELLLTRKKDLGGILLHAVFSKTNLEVMKAYLYFRQFDVNAYEFTFDVTESNAEISAKFMNEMSAVAAKAYELGGEKELRKISLFDGYFKALDEQRRSENYCGSGKSLLSIDSRNKIYACPLDVGMKNREVGAEQTVDQAKLADLQSPLIDKNNCGTCWARFLCGGGCLYNHQALTGHKHKKHVSFCERQRYLISLSVLYYEQCRA